MNADTQQTQPNHDHDDNHFFDVVALSPQELDMISGGVPCSYLGVHDYRLMMSYATRNYSC